MIVVMTSHERSCFCRQHFGSLAALSMDTTASLTPLAATTVLLRRAGAAQRDQQLRARRPSRWRRRRRAAQRIRRAVGGGGAGPVQGPAAVCAAGAAPWLLAGAAGGVPPVQPAEQRGAHPCCLQCRGFCAGELPVMWLGLHEAHPQLEAAGQRRAVPAPRCCSCTCLPTFSASHMIRASLSAIWALKLSRSLIPVPPAQTAQSQRLAAYVGNAPQRNFAQQDAEECWTQLMYSLRSVVKVRCDFQPC